MIPRFILALLGLVLSLAAAADQSLQAWIDTALPGTVLRLPAAPSPSPASGPTSDPTSGTGPTA